MTDAGATSSAEPAAHPWAKVRVDPLLLGLTGTVALLGGGWVMAKVPGLASGVVAVPAALVRLRHVPEAHLVAFGSVVVALVVVVAAWGELLYVVRRTGDLALVRRCALAWNVPLLLAPPLFSLDGWAYAAQGSVVAHGFSPYVYGPAVLAGTTGQPMLEAMDSLWTSAPTPYGPLQLGYSDLVAHGIGSPLFAVWALRLEGLLGLVLLAWAVPRLARAAGRSAAVASALVIGSPFVLVTGIAGMHNDLLMTGLATAGAALAVERSWALGAVAVGLGAGIKIPALAACLAVALLSLPSDATFPARLRRIGAASGIAVATLAVTGLATGLGDGWLHALTVPDRALPSFAPLALLPAPFHAIPPLLVLGAGGALALLCPAGAPRPALLAVGGALVAAAAFTGPAYPWYFLWPLPWLAALPLTRPMRVGLLGASVALCLLSTLGDIRGHHDASFAILALAAVAVVVVYLRYTASSGRIGRSFDHLVES